jgi:hypothetical protein
VALDAIQDFTSWPSWSETLRNCLFNLSGLLTVIKYTKVKTGVSETVVIKFSDGSRIKLTKFIPFKGKIKLSIKRDD